MGGAVCKEVRWPLGEDGFDHRRFASTRMPKPSRLGSANDSNLGLITAESTCLRTRYTRCQSEHA